MLLKVRLLRIRRGRVNVDQYEPTLAKERLNPVHPSHPNLTAYPYIKFIKKEIDLLFRQINSKGPLVVQESTLTNTLQSNPLYHLKNQE